MSEYDSGGFDLRLNMGPPVMPSPMIPQTPQPSNESAFVQSITHKFNSLDSNFSQLFDEVQKLTSLISQGSAAPQPPPPAPAPAAAPVPVAVTSQGKPPSFEKPDRFKGKSSEVETFVDAIQDAIELQGNSLATERSKCIYMSTFLENSPKQWYRGIKKSHPHLLDNFSLFLKAFIDHQTGSAAAYAAKFRELLVYVNWTEESKINQFYKNLKPATKDLIATKKRSKRPTNFDKYIEFVIEYDNCVHEREVERKEEKHGNSKSSSKSNSNSNYSYTSTPISSNTLPPGEPMQIDSLKTSAPKKSGAPRPPLSEDEKKRRRDLGLCSYCGGSGHFARDCPNKPKSKGSPSAGKA